MGGHTRQEDIEVSPTQSRISPSIHLSGRGSTRAEDAQGTPTQSHISPSTLVYEDTASGRIFREHCETPASPRLLSYPRNALQRKCVISFVVQPMCSHMGYSMTHWLFDQTFTQSTHRPYNYPWALRKAVSPEDRKFPTDKATQRGA